MKESVLLIYALEKAITRLVVNSKELLVTACANRKTINEVMYEVGHSDIEAFREVLKKITGMSPLEYRGKYNKEAMI